MSHCTALRRSRQNCSTILWDFFKSRSGRHFYLPRSKIVISHTSILNLQLVLTTNKAELNLKFFIFNWQKHCNTTHLFWFVRVICWWIRLFSSCFVCFYIQPVKTRQNEDIIKKYTFMYYFPKTSICAKCFKTNISLLLLLITYTEKKSSNEINTFRIDHCWHFHVHEPSNLRSNHCYFLSKEKRRAAVYGRTRECYTAH